LHNLNDFKLADDSETHYGFFLVQPVHTSILRKIWLIGGTSAKLQFQREVCHSSFIWLWELLEEYVDSSQPNH
jgi:hypothetical protein